MLRQARWHELPGIAATAAQMSLFRGDSPRLNGTESQTIAFSCASGAPAHWNSGPSCLLPLGWGRT
jgi:hypothetical protein